MTSGKWSSVTSVLTKGRKNNMSNSCLFFNQNNRLSAWITSLQWFGWNRGEKNRLETVLHDSWTNSKAEPKIGVGKGTQNGKKKKMPMENWEAHRTDWRRTSGSECAGRQNWGAEKDQKINETHWGEEEEEKNRYQEMKARPWGKEGTR